MGGNNKSHMQRGRGKNIIDCLLPSSSLLNMPRMGTICMSPPVKRHIDSHMSSWLSYVQRIYLGLSPPLAKDNWNMHELTFTERGL